MIQIIVGLCITCSVLVSGLCFVFVINDDDKPVRIGALMMALFEAMNAAVLIYLCSRLWPI